MMDRQHLCAREVTVLDMLDLLLVALGKKASEQDPDAAKLIQSSNNVLTEQYERGRRDGIKEGIRIGYQQALDDASRDAQHVMQSFMRPS